MKYEPWNSNLDRRLTVVVAVADACPAALELCLSRFADEVRGRGEVIVVEGATVAGTAQRVPGIRVILSRTGTLAPELWRDGLDATDSPLLAFTTAAMVPDIGWYDAMLARLDESGAAVVGGPIEPAERLSPTDRAVYLMRYGNYMSPLPDPAEIEPPGDNAVYRRDRLAGLEPAIEHGFWEWDVHRRLRARGDRLAMADRAAVTFQGGCSLGVSLGQRFRHARHYGAMRTAELSTLARLCRAAAAPAVPAVLLKRIAARWRGRGRPVAPWLSSLPGLAVLLSAWAAGEAWGTLAGPMRAHQPVKRPAIDGVRKPVRGGLS